MLNKYRYKEKDFHFSNRDKDHEHNIFTVIVGKNGTGKSRLMKSVIESIIGKSNRSGVIRPRDTSEALFQEIKDNIELDKEPEKIIAVSTSPFDKFPLDIYGHLDKKYSYLGLRDLRSRDLGMAYMANIYLSLLKSVINESGRANKICEVLGFLGYSPKIEARYHLEFSRRRIHDALVSSNPAEYFIDNFILNKHTPLHSSRTRGFFDEDRDIDISKVERFLEIYRNIDPSNLKPKVEIFLERSGILFPNNEIYDVNDLFFLAEIGVVRLREITLEKNNGKSFRIGDASSGEQSVVMSILGIASQICDDSLICIDEPEVCLHPEWQEKYIDILINTFKSFKGCHFLIATHSPLMVSKLNDKNCYLMKMENGEATNASQINNRSVDFQLVNIFGTPGFKNEYLTRELISVLSLFGQTGALDKITQEKLKFLLSLKDHISEKDPVFKLMDMAQEALVESL
ncbi:MULTISPECIES: ATP-binding protein [unclassified Pseudoalteromonas]|uniref:ATP-binding protein n=1 Tax=unclassified Pseudoalteromonas TaxID=194690 RepID=UPI00390C7C2F